MDISRMSVSVDAAAIVRLIEPELTRLVARALGQVPQAGRRGAKRPKRVKRQENVRCRENPVTAARFGSAT